jgi:general secretion pathway protein G
MISTLRARLDRRRYVGQAGFTLTELVVVCAVLVILSAVAFPLAKYSIKRQREIQLRHALQTLRNAIDEHKRFHDAGLIQPIAGTEGYPEELEILVEGADLWRSPQKKVKKFLRRIPVDPMTGEAEWGLRSYQDDWDTDSWGGENVYDVYSLSEGVGLDGVPYSEW